MQIVEQSSDRLVLHQSPWTLRFMGFSFALCASGLLTALVWTGHRHDHNVWVAFVVCGAFVLAGLAMLLGSTDRRVALDRTRQVAQVIRTGGVLRSEVTEVQFAEIRDVALETNLSISPRHDAAPGYRIVFVLRDGSRVPWTTVLTSDIGTQAACAAAARAFGGWDKAAARSGAAPTEVARPTPAPGTVAFRPTPKSVPTAVAPAPTQNVAWVMAFLAIFVLVGVSIVGVEVARLVTWRPVSAVVDGSRVEAVRGSKGGTSYRPVVSYTYRVEGRTYHCSTVTVILESQGWAWANRIASRYPPGAATTAYVNPHDPSQAYLVRDFSIMPLAFVLIPLVFGAIAWLSIRQQRRQMAMAASVPVPIITPIGVSHPRAA